MKISVIVPIYKVENYLYRCIDSLLEQTFSDFELILVDDGSPDDCPKICDEYEKKDNRVKVLHKENGGLSDARNAGLNIATGEYVAFVDSDDWVASDYLEVLFRTITREKADICECEVVRTNGRNEIPKYSEIINVYSQQDALELLIQEKVFHQYVWNKLYRRSVLAGISFPKGKINEDEFWTYQVFGKADLVVSINQPLYYYYQRDDSIMGREYDIKRLHAIEAKKLRQRYIELFFPKLERIAKINFWGSCIYAGQMSLLHFNKKDKENAKKILKDAVEMCNISLCECLTTEGHNKIWFTLAYFGFWNTCKLKNFLKKGF